MGRNDLAEKAQQAGNNHDGFTFWQGCKILGYRDTRSFHRVSFRTVANPDLDREAWKDFLSSRQTGSGGVNPSVWDFFPSDTPPDGSLGEPTTYKEFEIALDSMHCGKCGGIDDATVESLRFCGDKLLENAFSVILSMWNDGAAAETGLEAQNRFSR